MSVAVKGGIRLGFLHSQLPKLDSYASVSFLPPSGGEDERRSSSAAASCPGALSAGQPRQPGAERERERCCKVPTGPAMTVHYLLLLQHWMKQQRKRLVGRSCLPLLNSLPAISLVFAG